MLASKPDLGQNALALIFELGARAQPPGITPLETSGSKRPFCRRRSRGCFPGTMITGLSLLLIVTGLYLSITGHDGPAGTKFFCITVGILGWWSGNKLGELEERLDDLCSQKTSSAASLCDPAESGEPCADIISVIAVLPVAGTDQGPFGKSTRCVFVDDDNDGERIAYLIW